MNAIVHGNSDDRSGRDRYGLRNCWPILLLVTSLGWMLINLLLPLWGLFRQDFSGQPLPPHRLFPEGTDPFFWWFKSCLLPFVVAWFASARLKRRIIS